MTSLHIYYEVKKYSSRKPFFPQQLFCCYLVVNGSPIMAGHKVQRMAAKYILFSFIDIDDRRAIAQNFAPDKRGLRRKKDDFKD